MCLGCKYFFFSLSLSYIYGSLSHKSRCCSLLRPVGRPLRLSGRPLHDSGKTTTYQKPRSKREERRREREKKNLENVATATDFLRTLSSSFLYSSRKTKEQENNIPFKCRRPLYFRPYSVHDVWWYIGSDETLIFLFFVATVVILFFLRQSSIYKYELSISVFFHAVCGCGTPRKETRNTFCNFFARRQPSVRD